MKQLSLTTTKRQVSPKPLKQISTTKTQTTKWNSKTNVIITHPTLVKLESCKTMFQLKQIQAHMTVTSLITHTFPVSRLLAFSALSDNGNINHARAIFDRVCEPNTYIWNLMMRGYSNCGNVVMGFWVFREMVRKRVEMDCRSFVFGMRVCEGRLVHCLVLKMGFGSGVVVLNGLVHFYVGVRLRDARKVFDEIVRKDVISWTTMIDGYAESGCFDEALGLFDLMRSNGGVEPNEVTVIAVISACSRKGDLEMGNGVIEYVRSRGLDFGLNLQNAVLDMYVKCRCLSGAKEVFDGMEMKDVFSWTTMINGYAKCGDLECARKFFDNMPGRNVVSWNAMIAGYSQNECPEEAVKLFQEMMVAELSVTENTLVCVLSACGQLGCLHLGQWIHLHFIAQKRMQLNVILGNAFIDMYSKCGSIKAAEETFNKLLERDLVSWNSMIMGYATHGHFTEALMLFEQMKRERYKPDDITFVGILTACCHGGLVKEGRKYFESMKCDFGIEPKKEHYGCVIDLYGRLGLVHEAYQLITEMPMEPDTACWGALLNGCKIQGNLALAKIAAQYLLKLDPDDSGIYVLLANICANERSWGDVKMVRSMMREMGVKKNPGHSLIEVEGKFHKFLARDEEHSRYGEISRMLTEINLMSRLEEDCPNYLNFNVHCDDVLLNHVSTSSEHKYQSIEQLR